MLRYLAPLLLLLTLVSSAEVTKISIRDQFIPTDTYLALCTSDTPRTAFIAGVTGNADDGYKWDFSYGRHGTGHSDSLGLSPRTLSGCAFDALTTKAALLVIGLNADQYRSIKDHLDPSRSLEQNIDGALARTSMKVPAHAPEEPATKLISDLIFSLALPAEFSRLASDWDPPTLLDTDLPEPSEECNSAAVATGLPSLPCISLTALVALYQALSDAESHPWIHYDLELFVESKSISDVVALKSRMRADAPRRSGSIVSVYLATDGDQSPFDALTLINNVLHLVSSSKEGQTTKDVEPTNPFLGEPRAWSAVSVASTVSYWAFEGAGMIGDSPPISHAKFQCALVRVKFPQMKGDPSISNLHEPIILNSKLPNDPELSFREAKWRRYDSNRATVENIANTRASAYSGLSSGAVRIKKAYGKQVLNNDETAAAIRADFAVREFGWDEYANNKNFKLHSDSVLNYDEGRGALYEIVSLNSVAVSLRIDLSDRTRKQLATYKTFATDSYIGKVSSAVRYHKDLTVLGTRCADSDACDWSGLRAASPALELSIDQMSQRKFNNVLDIGRISDAASQGMIVFGPVADRAICKGDGYPTLADHDSFAGPREVTLRIKNVGPDDQIRIVNIGSRVKASWVQEATHLRSIPLKMNEVGTLLVRIEPKSGYEDLNLLYFLGKSGILGTLTIDYSQTSDERFKLVEIDSGDFGSGLGADSSKAYTIGVGQAPPGYSLIKACMFLTGDRLCNQWSTCSWDPAANAIIAHFTMQGHSEAQHTGIFDFGPPDANVWASSRGHLRAVFELKPDSIVLK
jgi:hypothetical protein